MERKGEITNVLVLVLALIPPNVPGIKGGVHLFSLTLTIALREAIEKQSWQILSGSVPEVPLYVTVRKKKTLLYSCMFYHLFHPSKHSSVAFSPPFSTYIYSISSSCLCLMH